MSYFKQLNEWLIEQDYKANWISNLVGYLQFGVVLGCYLFPRILAGVIFCFLLNYLLTITK